MGQLIRKAMYLAIVTGALTLSGCTGGTVHVMPVFDDVSPEPDPVPMAIEVEVDAALASRSLYYPKGANHGFHADVEIGDALVSYVNHVVESSFTPEEGCRSDSLAYLAPRARIKAELVNVTSDWSGGWAGANQTTETMFRWTLLDRQGQELWSDVFRGEESGGLGIGWSYKGNLRRRHESSLRQLFQATCSGIVNDPTIRLFAICQPLLAADPDSCVAVARNLLDQKVDCPSLAAVRQAVLMFAAQSGDEALTKLMLDEGAGLNDKWPYMDTTPLGLALVSGQIELARELVEMGADVNYTDSEGRSLLFVAARRQDQDALDFLAGRHASFAPVDTCGRSSLASALASRSLALAAEVSGNQGEAEKWNEAAVTYFSRAAGQFDAKARSFSKEKKTRGFNSFWSDVMKQSAANLAVIGQKYEARQDAQRAAEFKAMRSSSSHDEYFSKINEYRRVELQAMERSQRLSYSTAELRNLDFTEVNPRKITSEDDLDALIEHYQELAGQCREALTTIPGGTGAVSP